MTEELVSSKKVSLYKVNLMRIGDRGYIAVYKWKNGHWIYGHSSRPSTFEEAKKMYVYLDSVSIIYQWWQRADIKNVEDEEYFE